MHNMLLGQSIDAVERLLEVLHNEGMLLETLEELQIDVNAPGQVNPLHV